MVDTLSPRSMDEALIHRMKEERRPYMQVCSELNDLYFIRTHPIGTEGTTEFLSNNNATSRDRNYMTESVHDSSHIMSIESSTAGMQTGITPPSRVWFKSIPHINIKDLSNEERVHFDMIDRITNISYHMSNFYKETVGFYQNLLVFGTPLMYMEETGDDDVFWFKNLRMGSYMIGHDQRDRLSTVVREFQMTIEQLVQNFGFENLSTSSKDLARRGRLQDTVLVTHLVKRSNTYSNDNPFKKPYISRYFEGTTSASNSFNVTETNNNDPNNPDSHYLHTSGYDDMPYFATRWSSKDGDSYAASCPGIIAIQDVRQLQDYSLKNAQALAYEVHPHFLAHSSLRGVNTDFIPGGTSYASDLEALKGFKPAHDIRFNREGVLQKEFELRERISKMFYEDLFLSITQTPNRDRVTAREIEYRNAEKFTMLAPALENTEHEFLKPLKNRVFKALLKANKLPPTPQRLEGMGFEIKSIGRLAIMQQHIALGELDKFKETALEVSQVHGGIGQKVNFDKFLDYYSETSGIPNDIVRDQEATEALREVIAEQERKMQEAQGLEMEARAMQHLTQANAQQQQQQ